MGGSETCGYHLFTKTLTVPPSSRPLTRQEALRTIEAFRWLKTELKATIRQRDQAHLAAEPTGDPTYGRVIVGFQGRQRIASNRPSAHSSRTNFLNQIPTPSIRCGKILRRHVTTRHRKPISGAGPRHSQGFNGCFRNRQSRYQQRNRPRALLAN